MLLLHGDADTLVPFRMSELMLDKMKKAGVDVKLIRLPGGGHGFAMERAKHPEWPDFLAESVHWMDQHLRLLFGWIDNDPKVIGVVSGNEIARRLDYR
jgi:dipeptidyl aminopeptidase/acylaminoacyl peptidase